MTGPETRPRGSGPVPALFELESCQCEAVMPRLHGLRLLQVGMWGDSRFLTRISRLPYCVRVGLSSAAGADMQSSPHALPVLSKSIQAVFLPHTLEFTARPDALIAEVHRVLSDDGQVVVLSYNPFSCQGLTSFCGRRRNARWHGVAWTRAKLHAQGFAVAETRRYGTGWPALSGDRAADRRRRGVYTVRAFSAAYLILARKRIIPLTPTRQPARPRALEPAPLARQAVATSRCAHGQHPRKETGNKRRRCVA